MNAIEVSIRMKADAIRFYREAADKTKHEAGKKTFLSIADDEKEHFDMLARLLKTLDLKSGKSRPGRAAKTIFDEMGEMVDAVTDAVEAFEIAMEIKRKGIAFYKKAALKAKSRKERALFERLADAGEQRYNIFADSCFLMNDSSNWYMWEEHSMTDGGTQWA